MSNFLERIGQDKIEDQEELESLRQQNAELTAELQATRLQMITDFGQYQEAHEKVNELTAQLVQQSVDAANEFNVHHEAMLKEVDKATAQRDAAMNALVSISKIQNRYDCGDWDEIEEARSIADAAIANCNNKEK